MKKIISGLILLFIVNVNLYAEKTLVSCTDAKTEFYSLENDEAGKYQKDSMKLDIVFDEKQKKLFVSSKAGKSELIDIRQSKNDIFQFIEQVPSGHNVLYTLHAGILTVQKSYDMLGHPIMVNTVLKCK